MTFSGLARSASYGEGEGGAIAQEGFNHMDRAVTIYLPSAVSIIAAGATRSGSTALFNMIRLLLEQSDTPSTAGWAEDIKEPLNSTFINIYNGIQS
jgi:hypothetical protein